MTLAALELLAKRKLKAIAAGVGAAVVAYVVACVSNGTALSLTGLIGAVVAAPVLGTIVHQLENAETPKPKPIHHTRPVKPKP